VSETTFLVGLRRSLFGSSARKCPVRRGQPTAPGLPCSTYERYGSAGGALAPLKVGGGLAALGCRDVDDGTGTLTRFFLPATELRH
jgi:hypothetical protein